jgi:DNA-binding transcriptional MerR regulator
MEKALPAIPAKRYFTIGEVSDLCGVKPYVLRYWEQEFTQLKPMKRRGNRRYYQHHEVLLIRRIRDLLYDQGFTISGARNRLADAALQSRAPLAGSPEFDDEEPDEESVTIIETAAEHLRSTAAVTTMAVSLEVEPSASPPDEHLRQLRVELLSIRDLLSL